MRLFSSILRSPKKNSLLQHSCQYILSDRFLFSKTTTTKKTHHHIYQGLFSFYFPSSLHTQHYARFSSTRNLLEVEIVSKEFIKPTTPTPEHLRKYEVSFLDQLLPNIYVPFIYFYQNNHENNLILTRKQLLKQSLSETLTRFYPLAGRIKDSTQIDCNDDGVYYVEAKVLGQSLSDLLDKPDNKSIHRLLPVHPDSTELHSLTDLVIVQVTSFSCGGISIGLYTSHKLLDAYSMATFVKGWAATARASPEEICPNFIAPSIFPHHPSLSGKPILLPRSLQHKIVTRRLVFPASSLATLKKKAGSSRAMGVIAFLYKWITAASQVPSETSGCSKPKYTSLSTMVNLRERSSPPMPPYCIGNIFWTTLPIHCSADEDLGLDSIAQRIKSSTDKINGDLIEEMKGEGFTLKMEKPLDELETSYSDRNIKHIVSSSLCNTGIYEADFGWGKPIWVSFGWADSKSLPVDNFVLLMDTRSGNGIEAWVFLAEHEMAVFERNPELLSLASVDPSPLQIVH